MVGMTVSDMDRSVDFYTKVLDFERVSDDEVVGASLMRSSRGCSAPACAWFACGSGEEYLQLTQYLAPPGRPAPVDCAEQRPLVSARCDHRARHGQRLRAAAPVQGAARLDRTAAPAEDDSRRRRHPRILLSRSRWSPPRGACSSPPDKGDPKWHAPTDRLFLGIDHTAIVVADTRGESGFLPRRARVSGGRREHEFRDGAGAPEQRARRPAPHHRSSGPGGAGHRVPRVPGPARRPAYPVRRASERPGALADDRARARRGCGGWQPSGAGNFRLISSAPVELPDTTLGFRRALLVRDPDGHVVQLAEQ